MSRAVRAVPFAFLIGVAACGAGSGSGGGQSVASPSPGGDAARIICEAECRRVARCASEQGPACSARCPTLPVRTPPVWRTDWAGAHARCADQATCATDDDERCLFMFMVQEPPNEAVQACLSLVSPALRDVRTQAGRRCLVLGGLTQPASKEAAACLRSGAHPHSCIPPFDWK